ncbi:MAG TPA: hypothetical protein VMU34_14740 [Mycobacterium sp.]|nr:hypothetical protein [Mycobacterium sp.]
MLFAEGAGGRPGDTDAPVVAGLHYGTFVEMGEPADTRDVIAATVLAQAADSGGRSGGQWSNPQRRTGIDTW